MKVVSLLTVFALTFNIHASNFELNCQSLYPDDDTNPNHITATLDIDGNKLNSSSVLFDEANYTSQYGSMIHPRRIYVADNFMVNRVSFREVGYGLNIAIPLNDVHRNHDDYAELSFHMDIDVTNDMFGEMTTYETLLDEKNSSQLCVKFGLGGNGWGGGFAAIADDNQENERCRGMFANYRCELNKQ